MPTLLKKNKKREVKKKRKTKRVKKKKKKKREKKGKQKKEKKRKKEKGEERERELAARFAAAVGLARAAMFGRSTTRTRNKKKRNTMMGIEFGCRNGGSSEKDFGESGARTGKNLE